MPKITKKDADKLKKQPAFIVDTCGRDFNGIIKYVTFIHGVGVLDLRAIAAHRPEWVQVDENQITFSQIAGPDKIVEFYANVFKDRGAKVTKIAGDDAEDFREALEKGRFAEINAKWGGKHLEELFFEPDVEDPGEDDEEAEEPEEPEGSDDDEDEDEKSSEKDDEKE